MHKLAAFTGAGISKASGIPTFEEMGNIREKLTRDYFKSHPAEFFEVVLNLKRAAEQAVPNPAHLALAEYNIPVVTMNVDGLHKKAGSKGVLEVHGNLEFVFCEKCKGKFAFDVVENSIFCPDCKDLLKPNVVLYGDNIPLYFNALEVLGDTEELLVVGTSFYTSTAWDLVGRVERAGIKVTTINADAEKEVPLFVKSIFS